MNDTQTLPCDLTGTPALRAAQRSRRAAGCLLLLLVCLLGLRMLGPSDISDNDQAGPMTHVVDVAYRGHWLMQHGPDGELASKPPMYPWIGALGVLATRDTSEFMLKLPSVLAMLVLTLLVYDLAKRPLGQRGAILAAAMWTANYHVFKLMYTARPDMLVTMFILLGVWCVERQRPLWREGMKATRLLPWIALFWLSLAGGILTKGPPAALSLLWLLGALIYDRAWRRCAWPWQVLGLTAALAIPGTWLAAVFHAYPAYHKRLTFEVTDRITGHGTGAGRHTSPLAIPAYFLARFAPWSVLFIAGAVLLKQVQSPKSEVQSHEAPPHLITPSPCHPPGLSLRAAVAWVVLVLVFFMIPQGKRADYILPSYAAAAILAAAVVMRAQRQTGVLRVITHLVLGGVCLAGIAMPAAALLTHDPRPLHAGVSVMHPVAPVTATITAGMGAALALMAGAVGLLWTHRRRYEKAAWATAVVLAGIMGLYNARWDRSVKLRQGDAVRFVVHAAKQQSERTGLPVRCVGLGYNPASALLGTPAVPDAAALGSLGAHDLLILTDETHWPAIKERFSARATPLRTVKAPGDHAEALCLVRIQE